MYSRRIARCKNPYPFVHLLHCITHDEIQRIQTFPQKACQLILILPIQMQLARLTAAFPNVWCHRLRRNVGWYATRKSGFNNASIVFQVISQLWNVSVRESSIPIKQGTFSVKLSPLTVFRNYDLVIRSTL